MSIANLKRNVSSMLGKMEEAAASKGGSFNNDPDVWKPFLDDTKGTGEATIRFLPPVDGEELPVVTVYSRSITGASGDFYIENDLSTIGQPDPVFHLAKKIWNSKDLDQKQKEDIARPLNRKENHYANIMVVTDQGRPQNEGGVFLYKFGNAVFKLIEAQTKPKFESDPKINPFNPWEAGNLRLRVVRDGEKKKAFWKYDLSSWDGPTALFGGNDAQIEAVYALCKPLKPLIDPSRFKTYDALLERLVMILGETYHGFDVIDPQYTDYRPKNKAGVSSTASAQMVSRPTLIVPEPTATAAPRVIQATVQAQPQAAVTQPVVSPTADEAMSFFEQLAKSM